MAQKATTMINGMTLLIYLYKVTQYCPNDDNDTYDFTSHSKCLFVVFSFNTAIKQNWNNEPNA